MISRLLPHTLGLETHTGYCETKRELRPGRFVRVRLTSGRFRSTATSVLRERRNGGESSKRGLVILRRRSHTWMPPCGYGRTITC